MDSDRMAGAATNTSGNMVIHEMSQENNQFAANSPVLSSGKLAMAAAIAHVKPDWMKPNTK